VRCSQYLLDAFLILFADTSLALQLTMFAAAAVIFTATTTTTTAAAAAATTTTRALLPVGSDVLCTSASFHCPVTVVYTYTGLSLTCPWALKASLLVCVTPVVVDKYLFVVVGAIWALTAVACK
jgi:hypothetical protein